MIISVFKLIVLFATLSASSGKVKISFEDDQVDFVKAPLDATATGAPCYSFVPASNLADGTTSCDDHTCACAGEGPSYSCSCGCPLVGSSTATGPPTPAGPTKEPGSATTTGPFSAICFLFPEAAEQRAAVQKAHEPVPCHDKNGKQWKPEGRLVNHTCSYGDVEAFVISADDYKAMVADCQHLRPDELKHRDQTYKFGILFLYRFLHGSHTGSGFTHATFQVDNNLMEYYRQYSTSGLFDLKPQALVDKC